MKRKFLTQREVESMLRVAAAHKNGRRDVCLIMMCFRHGYRISEALSLTYQDLDLEEGFVCVRRLKQGFSTVQPLLREECVALAAWTAERAGWPGAGSPHVFISRRGRVLSRQQAYRIVRGCGLSAGMAVEPHPHMLRHACGYALANRGVDTRLIQDYLGHRNIRHTVRYTASNVRRFAGIWDGGRDADEDVWGGKDISRLK